MTLMFTSEERATKANQTSRALVSSGKQLALATFDNVAPWLLNSPGWEQKLTTLFKKIARLHSSLATCPRAVKQEASRQNIRMKRRIIVFDIHLEQIKSFALLMSGK
jgi:hypothetical protein